MERYLLIATANWAPTGDALLPDEQWDFAAPGRLGPLMEQLMADHELVARHFSGVIMAAWPTAADRRILLDWVDPYRVIATPAVLERARDGENHHFLRRLQPFNAGKMDHQSLIDWVRTRLFGGQTGTKLSISDLVFNPWYQGPIDYQGFDRVTVQGDFGPHFRQLATYRWGMWVDPFRTLQLWPEYTAAPGVELRYVIYEEDPTNRARMVNRREFSGSALDRELVITGAATQSYLNVSVEVRGRGQVSLGPVHYRWSRFEAGEFYPGGERIVDPVDRGELDLYFSPGDLKPPLNVYFSGYRRAEGFEGFYMMRELGTPFMLIADPRLEGGAFYLGSPALEQALKDKIAEKMHWLGFDWDQVNFSGISMGSFGACYYGVQCGVHAILAMNLILSLGTVAKREMTERFGIFPTALDLLQRWTPAGMPLPAAIDHLNARFWDQFTNADLSQTSLILPHMDDDDYDDHAYQKLLHHVDHHRPPRRIIGKGFPGHHLDGGQRELRWFLEQYHAVLHDDFGREEE